MGIMYSGIPRTVNKLQKEGEKAMKETTEAKAQLLCGLICLCIVAYYIFEDLPKIYDMLTSRSYFGVSEFDSETKWKTLIMFILNIGFYGSMALWCLGDVLHIELGEPQTQTENETKPQKLKQQKGFREYLPFLNKILWLVILMLFLVIIKFLFFP